MREKRQISHAEKLQENVYRCSTLNKVEHKSPLLSVSYAQHTPPQSTAQGEGGEKEYFIVKKASR